VNIHLITGKNHVLSRIKIILLLICILLLLPSTHLYAQQPNYVFITIDDLNDYIEGFDGHPQTETPNISTIAANGTSFLRAYASSPQCGPSRLSLFTGKDCAYTQVYHNSEYTCGNFRDNFTPAEGNEEVFTLPEVLKNEGGYYTYGISKFFHCHQNLPDYDSLNPDVCERSQSWNKLLVFNNTGEEEEVFNYGIENSTGVSGFEFCKIPNDMEPLMQDYLTTDSAISFIEQYAENPDAFSNKPFFLAMGYRRPHGPLYIPEKYFLPYYNNNLSSDPFTIPYNNPPAAFPYNGVVMPPQPDENWSDFYSLPAGGVAEALAREHNVHESMLSYGFDMDMAGTLPVIDPALTTIERYEIINESERANAVMAYLAAIRFVDAQIGRFMEEMEQHPDILNNTIFVILGDHGYSLGEKTHWRKGALWETDTRAPLIISDYRNPSGQSSIRLVSFLDIFPTLLELSDIAAPAFTDGRPYLDGYSLLPLMEDPKAAWSRPVLSSYRNTDDLSNEGSCFPQYSVRTDDYHYIRYRTNGAAGECDENSSTLEEELYQPGPLYNIDPYEWNNLIGVDGTDQIIAEIDNYLPDSIHYLSFSNYALETENSGEDFSSSFFPNPSNGNILLSVQGPPEDITICISDIHGRRVFLESWEVPASGYVQQPLDLSRIPAGAYYLIIWSKSAGTITMPLVLTQR
jgi:arylsulfatase A-like enzyme